MGCTDGLDQLVDPDLDKAQDTVTSAHVFCPGVLDRCWLAVLNPFFRSRTV